MKTSNQKPSKLPQENEAQKRVFNKRLESHRENQKRMLDNSKNKKENPKT